MAELPAELHQVEGSRRTPVAGAARTGPADPAERLSVSVRLRRRPDGPSFGAALQDIIAGTRDPMSHDEFAAAFGADPRDIAAIEAFAAGQGLAVEQVSVSRRTVVLGGTVAQLTNAFAVDLGRFEADGTSYRGRDGHVGVPAPIAPLGGIASAKAPGGTSAAAPRSGQPS